MISLYTIRDDEATMVGRILVSNKPKIKKIANKFFLNPSTDEAINKEIKLYVKTRTAEKSLRRYKTLPIQNIIQH